MNLDHVQVFNIVCIFIAMMFIAGVYCVVMTRNMMRALIGLEIITKGVTLLLILAGYVTGNMATAQAIVITLIIVEVVVIAITAGVILCIYRHTNSLDRSQIMDLKG
jgi:NADH-quinone oxidoreductase subunit K